MTLNRTLADSLDALYAGRDSDSGIRDPELLASCVEELNARVDELAALHPYRLTFLDIAWDLSVQLYSHPDYSAEDRLHFIDWLCEEAGWDR